MPQHSLTAENLTKTFAAVDGPVVAVSDVNFSIHGADFFTMLGPSGCGKTTTLRMIAGLESCSGGRILFDGSDFSRQPAFQRGIGMVFQSYALFPHLSVFENTAYGLRIRRLPEAEIKNHVARMLDMLGLGALAARYPADLSGGQQQRVSIARALVYEPTMLLLDEPLANLDAKLRVQMREEIRRIQKSLGIMTIYVTHDQEEAMSVSDRIGVFNQGKLLQFGDPREVYAEPATLFVADFVGKANFFSASISGRDASGARIALRGLGEIGVTRQRALGGDEAAAVSLGRGFLLVRPEHLRLRAEGGGIECRVKRAQFLGGVTRYIVECPEASTDVVVDSARAIDGLHEGAGARLGFAPADALLFCAPT